MEEQQAMKEIQQKPNPLKRVWHSFSSQNVKVKIALLAVLVSILTIPSITAFVANTNNTENSATHAASTPAIISPIPHWIIVKEAAIALNASPIGAPFIQAINTPNTYELTHSTQTTDPLSNATHVESFKSYQDIQTAFAKKQILPNIKVILYDNEHWSGTPDNEQQHPFTYVPLAEKLVHKHGYLFMNTPAADLGKLLDPTATDNYAAYVQLKLATLSQYTDIFEIQAQNAPSVSEYISFAQQAITQAKTANSKAVILLGITAKANGPTSQELIQEVQGTAGITDGYWFNIPGQTPDISVALPVIQALQSVSPTPPPATPTLMCLPTSTHACPTPVCSPPPQCYRNGVLICMMPRGGWCNITPMPSCTPIPVISCPPGAACVPPNPPSGGWCSTNPTSNCTPKPPQCYPGTKLGIVCPAPPVGGWCPINPSEQLTAHPDKVNSY